MKNIIILALAYWVWVLWKEKKQTPAAEGYAGAPPMTGGSAAGQTPTAAAKANTHLGPAPVLSCYGNYSNPAGAQNLTLELTPADAAAYTPEDSVKVENSNMYPLYYRVASIDPAPGGNTAVTLRTLFLGSETDLFLNHEGAHVSGFGGETTRRNKSAFL